MPHPPGKYSDKLCEQRKHNGDPCQSPALYGERFCHYHKVTGKPKAEIDNNPSGHKYLPVFEDAVSIQSAISDVCEMMLHRRIEPKEASICLYAMQVASANMAQLNGDRVLRTPGRPKKSQPEESQPANADQSVSPSSTDAKPANDATVADKP